MELSEIVRRSQSDLPTWLWCCAKKSDLPWIRADGLVPLRGKIYLVQSRKEAFPSPDRLILRINSRLLNRENLQRDNAWKSWVEGKAVSPPAELLAWWERAGVCRNEPTRKALHTQIARVNPGRVWTYQGIIPVTAIACANEAGFYVSLRPIQPEEQSMRISAIVARVRQAEDVGQPAPDLAQLFPARAFGGWTADAPPQSDKIAYKKFDGNVQLALFSVEYIGPQVSVRISWPLPTGSLDCPLNLLQVAGKYTYEKTYPSVDDFRADLSALQQLAWGLGSTNLKTAARRR